MKLYSMITSAAAMLGEDAARTQRMPHECLNLDGFTKSDIYYGQYLGEYPLQSPLEVNNGWHARHAERVRKDVRARVGKGQPPALSCIDYENWKLLMDGDPHSAHQDAGRYEACAAAVILTALREAERTGPKSRWGLYDWPGTMWSTEYPDKLKEYHDRTRYVIDSADTFFVVFYLPDKDDQGYSWTRTAYRNVIAECERLAPAKPIVAIISRTFAVDPWPLMPQSEQALQVREICLELKDRKNQHPDDGIAVWGSINKPGDIAEIQAHLDLVRATAASYLPSSNNAR